tara:strand:- start:318 stop:638 length:321 start_codon:yes stop_codon:yes gene_type:complete
MKSEPRKINGMLKNIVEAINHYNKTGKHKQVVFRYKAENRTPFDFSSWKHDSQEDSPRMLLPEELYVSGSGDILVRGFENRYNLKQYQKQYKNDHPRSYRLDRMIV